MTKRTSSATRPPSASTPRRPGRPAGGDAAVRDALLQCSRKLFLQYGFGAVSMRRIAAAADTTPAMIHYYFGDKLGLYRAMIEAAVQPLVVAVQRLGETADATGDASGDSGDNAVGDDNGAIAANKSQLGLEGVMRAYMGMVAANPWFPALIIQEVLAHDGPMRGDFIERFAARTAPALVAVLRREREEGKLRHDVDPQFAAVSMLSLCVFPFASLPVTGPVLGFRPEGEALDRFIAHTVRLFRDGVVASQEAGHA